MTKKFIIIESNKKIENFEDSIVILWNETTDSKNNFLSLPLFIEENATVYKDRFLLWITAFSKAKVNKSNLEDYYIMNNGLSFFWLTSLCQRFNALDSSKINMAIKLFALEDLINQNEIDEIELISEDVDLIKTLQLFCKNNNIRFQNRFSLYLQRLLSLLYFPKFLLSFIYLIYFILIRRLRFCKPDIKLDTTSAIFFDIFINIKNKSEDNLYFESHYWTKLPELLENLNISVTWAHFFYKHKPISSVRAAEKVKDKLNGISLIQQHFIIDSFLTIDVVFFAFLKYLKIYLKTLKLRNKENLFVHKDITGFNFFYIFKNEFFGSCYGKDAIRINLYYLLIDKYLSKLSYKSIGFYIQENQPWETILINLWRKYNHGNIIGIPHTTVRFWDLRYFYDSRLYHNPSTFLPFPDYIAVNGSFARHQFILNKVPLNKLKQVEALRYLHIKPQNHSITSIKKEINILMCGDYLSSTNRKMVFCLKELNDLFEHKIFISVKAHPAKSIPLAYFEGLNVIFRTESISELLNEFDFIFTSNISSAAVDVYLSGKPLVQFVDWMYFNMSPLREVNGIHYISNGKELFSVIANWDGTDKIIKEDYFYLDCSLIKWKKLLENYI
jgi:surface carbohydrate biosynthesis protein (TIGR04326 family)